MHTIYKYALNVENKQILKLPLGSKILSTAFQEDTLCIWALVDKDEDFLESYKIYIYGTGHDIGNIYVSFIGTVFTGNLVFHVFSEKIK